MVLEEPCFCESLANARRYTRTHASRQKKHCHSSSISFSLGNEAAGSSDRSGNENLFLVDAPVNNVDPGAVHSPLLCSSPRDCLRVFL